MKPNLICVFDMRSWPAVRAPRDFSPLLSSPTPQHPRPQQSFQGPVALFWWHLVSSVSRPPSLLAHAPFPSTSLGCHNWWCCIRQRRRDEFTRLKNSFTWGGRGLLKESWNGLEGTYTYPILEVLGKGWNMESRTRGELGESLQARIPADTPPEVHGYVSTVPVLQGLCQPLAKLWSLFGGICSRLCRFCVAQLVPKSAILWQSWGHL